MANRKLQHRIEYLLLRALEAGIGGISARAAQRVGERLGAVVQSPLGIRVEVVERNLRRAFPDASAEWVRATMREAYRHLGRESAAMLRLAKLNPEAVG